MKPSLPRVVLSLTLCALGALGTVGCASDVEATTPDGTSEDDATAAIRLTAAPAPADLAASLAVASDADSGTKLSVEAFRYDAARVTDPGKVIAAVRRKSSHAAKRVDEGAVTDAVLRATLDEYGVAEEAQRNAISTATRAAVGARPTSLKLWLRSDDVPNADSEWAEVLLIYVSPESGTVLKLTIRYDA